MCRHAAYYEQIGADLEVVKWVRHGYEMKLKEWPLDSFTKNNRSATEDPLFVWHELRRLVALGVMEEVQEKPRVVNALSVVFSNKKRLVWDVREINSLIEVEKLALESLDDAAELLEENFFGATSDLEAGYFQVGLAKEQKTLLGCAFENPDTQSTVFFVSNTMILGERSAVHSFTRLLKPVVKQARLLGWKGVVYVDDFKHIGKNKEECVTSRQILKSVANKAGWLFSEAKEQEPSTCTKFLGYNLNTVSMKFEVPEDKLKHVLMKVNVLLARKFTTTNRKLAKVVGHLASLYRAFPGFSRLMLRSCYATLEVSVEQGDWDRPIKLSEEAKYELSWWRVNLRRLNGGPLKQDLQEVVTNLFGDASGTGLYLYQENPRKTLLSKPLEDEDRKKSSTHRELMVFKDFYTTKEAEALAGKVVTHHTDNKGTFFIVKNGSRMPELQELALQIFLACRDKNIKLKVEWKRRSEEEMEDADEGSRGPWSLREEFTVDSRSRDVIMKKFLPDLDCMATRLNRLTRRYFSLAREEEAEGRNLFAQRLGDEIFWLHPHPGQLLKCLR